ncbi:galactose-1-phosphate uridylyltransferase [Syntrophomonas erecta subsp. sporosyntropha]
MGLGILSEGVVVAAGSGIAGPLPVLAEGVYNSGYDKAECINIYIEDIEWPWYLRRETWMPELRRDLFRDNWVVVATDVVLKPKDFPINKTGVGHPVGNNFCPFCEGHEDYTTRELAAFRKEGTRPDTPGWQVRTIPNKFSVFNLEGELSTETRGVFTRSNGLGQHEVIVETPQHGIEFHRFPVSRFELVYRMMQLRYNTLAKDQRLKYIQIYKNRGLFAGASLEHSHSQIIALPMVPAHQQGVPRYYRENQACLLCSMLKEEEEALNRIVYETEHFVVLCPYASRFSYEAWIIPRRHTEHYGEITREELKNLAEVSTIFFRAMVDLLDNTSYNIVINTAPVNVPYQGGYHWYMEVTPRLIVSNGIELATGYHVNPVSPEIAAEFLRNKLSKV